MGARTDIIKAFLKLYSEKDLSKITVNNIVTRAGYCRSVFYVYFKSVDHLLELAEETCVQNAIKDAHLFLDFFFHDNRNNAKEKLLKRVNATWEYTSVLFVKDLKMIEKYKDIYYKLFREDSAASQYTEEEARCIAEIMLATFLDIGKYQHSQDVHTVSTEDFLEIEKELFNLHPELWKK